jgi:WD40 repeat protein
VADDRIRIWDIATATVLLELRDRNHKTVTEGGWSPSGDRVVCRSWDGTVTVWNLRQKTVLFSLQQQQQQRQGRGQGQGQSNLNITAVAWNPRSPSVIATGSQDSWVMLWDGNDGTLLSTLTKISDYYIISLSWSPDGKELAIVTLSTHVHIYCLDSREVIHFLQHSNQVNAVTWNPSGSYIASASDDDTVRIWNPRAQDSSSSSGERGGGAGVFTKHRCAVRAVSWSSDGERIASGDECGNILIWHWATHQIMCSWNGHTDSIHTLIWSPDSVRLASSSRDGTVVVWDSSNETKRRERGGKRRETKKFKL